MIFTIEILPVASLLTFLGFPCGSAGKESSCNAGGLGSIPGLGLSLGEGKVYPLQYSGLENSMDCHKKSDITEWLSVSLITFFSVLSIHLNEVKLYFCSSKWSSISHFIWFNLMIKSGGIIRFSFKFLTQILCSSENFMFHYLGWNIMVDFFLFVMLRLISGLRFNLTQSL